jgi:hypothetical protein
MWRRALDDTDVCSKSRGQKTSHFLPLNQAYSPQTAHALAVSRPASRSGAARRALVETVRSGVVNSAKPDRKAALREPLRRDARPRGARPVHCIGLPELLLLPQTAADTSARAQPVSGACQRWCHSAPESCAV